MNIQFCAGIMKAVLECLKRSRVFRGSYYKKRNSQYLEKRLWTVTPTICDDIILDSWVYLVIVQSPTRVQLFATHGLQYTRLLCPLLLSRVCSNLCPLSLWCHPTHSNMRCGNFGHTSSHLLSSHPLSAPSPALSLSQHQGLFQWIGSSHQVPKYWSFSFSLSRSNEYSGLISFRIDWFNLLAAQRTLKGLLQHHNAKASIL